MSEDKSGIPRILLFEPIHDAGRAILASHCAVDEIPPGGALDDVDSPHDVKGIIIRSARVDWEVMSQLPGLVAVVKHGAGVDSIDIGAASAKGVIVASTPEAGSAAVAEHAFALALAVVKRLALMQSSVESGEFGIRNVVRTREMFHKTLGIVGYGHIGQRVASIASLGFQMDVVVFDPNIKASPADHPCVTRFSKDLEGLLRASDFVSLHAPLSSATKGMIGRNELRFMRSSAILVNTSRGGLVDEEALVEALDAGELAGAGLDVFMKEPPDRDDPLFRRPNVVLSPHVGGLSVEAARRTSVASGETMLSLLRGERSANILNSEVLLKRPFPLGGNMCP